MSRSASKPSLLPLATTVTVILAACGVSGSDLENEEVAGHDTHYLSLTLDDGREFHDGSAAISFRETSPATAEFGFAAYELGTGRVFRFVTHFARPVVANRLLVELPGVAVPGLEDALVVECATNECSAAPERSDSAASASAVLRDEGPLTVDIVDDTGLLSGHGTAPWAFRCSVLPSSLGLDASPGVLIGDEAVSTPFCQAALAELGVTPSIHDATATE